MVNLPRLLLVLATIALLSSGATAQTIETAGPAVIVDGDTIEIGAQAIRIHGIDAPETGQKCQLPKGTWIGHEFDDYGRLIARCRTDNEPDLGARLVAFAFAEIGSKSTTSGSSGFLSQG